MRKKKYRFVLSWLILVFSLGLSFQGLDAQDEIQLAKAAQMKKKDPTLKIRWDKNTGVPTRLAGKLSDRVEADAKEIALRFFRDNKALFKITDPRKEIYVTAINKDARKWNHVKLQQVYKSLPVEGKTIVVHINDNNEIRVVSGHYMPGISLNTTPTVASPKAIAVAKKDLDPKKEITEIPKAQLVIYPYKNKSYLTWKILLVSTSPLGEFIYYVDARTGDVIYRYNNLKFR
ncbi:MAG: PepSY domain-containing protein [Candidatus Aminicenantes bacterium]|nr:MAG: PepSY domain-containing protein [Candidatus Aminicenantes bacterium]